MSVVTCDEANVLERLGSYPGAARYAITGNGVVMNWWTERVEVTWRDVLIFVVGLAVLGVGVKACLPARVEALNNDGQRIASALEQMARELPRIRAALDKQATCR